MEGARRYEKVRKYENWPYLFIYFYFPHWKDCLQSLLISFSDLFCISKDLHLEKILLEISSRSFEF